MPMSASPRIAAAVVGAAFLVSACGTSTSGDALKPIGSGLQGRNGMHATVYARGIRQMSAFALDSRGRLWVTRSGATTHVDDAVYVVPRRSATPVKVVSSIRGPLGLVWAESSLYVSSLDGVYRFSGFDGTRLMVFEVLGGCSSQAARKAAAARGNTTRRGTEVRVIFFISERVAR